MVVNVSVRNAWQSHAKLRWLVPPGPPVAPGSCIFITEGPKTVALFTVEYIAASGDGAARHPFPNGSLRLRAGRQRLLLVRGDQWLRAATTSPETAS